METISSKKLSEKFTEAKGRKLLSLYVTAGYPERDSLPKILRTMDAAGVDVVEVGMPFSDPLADGPTIQQSSSAAIANGFTMDLLFEQLEGLRGQLKLSLVYMGYLNSILQYGAERFAKRCQNAGIEALIIPDLPIEIYLSDYKAIFEAHGLGLCWLVTPRSTPERIRLMGQHASPFLYLVASSSVTGKTANFSEEQQAYVRRVRAELPALPLMVGFGIHDAASFKAAAQEASGAIIGSAFIRAISPEKEGTLSEKVQHFIKHILD